MKRLPSFNLPNKIEKEGPSLSFITVYVSIYALPLASSIKLGPLSLLILAWYRDGLVG